MSTNSEPIEDFLEVDREIPGQRFVCLSFVSPEKVLQNKEKFLFHKYFTSKLDRYQKKLNTLVDNILNKNLTTIDSSQLTNIRDKLTKCLNDDRHNFTNYVEKYDDFMYANQDKYEEEFDEQNDFRTSVRGVKIRGTYGTPREAKIRAKVLQRLDPSFNIYVGQVGMWLAWDPQADKVSDQEYLNNDLNKLVKEYKVNEVKRDLFYQEQTRNKTKEAIKATVAQKLKLEELKKEKELTTENVVENQPETTTEAPTTEEPTTEEPTTTTTT